MLFQGLNFMEWSVSGITLQKILELLSWNVIAKMQGINFVGIMKVKLAFCMGKLRVKWLKNRGIAAAHTRTTYYIGSAAPGPMHWPSTVAMSTF